MRKQNMKAAAGKKKPAQPDRRKEHGKPEHKSETKPPAEEEKKSLLAPPPGAALQDRCVTPQVATYDTINEAIHEYLLKSGLFKTVDSFQVSCETDVSVARAHVREGHDRQLRPEFRSRPELRPILSTRGIPLKQAVGIRRG